MHYRRTKGTEENWPQSLIKITEYTEDDLNPMIKEIFGISNSNNEKPKIPSTIDEVNINEIPNENKTSNNAKETNGKRLLNVFELYMNC